MHMYTVKIILLCLLLTKFAVYKCAMLSLVLSLRVHPGSEGTAVSFVCCSGEAATGEAGAGGAQETEAGRGAGEGGHILTCLSFTVLFPLCLTTGYI